MSGKGDKRRPTDEAAYGSGFDRAFRNKDNARPIKQGEAFQFFEDTEGNRMSERKAGQTLTEAMWAENLARANQGGVMSIDSSLADRLWPGQMVRKILLTDAEMPQRRGVAAANKPPRMTAVERMPSAFGVWGDAFGALAREFMPRAYSMITGERPTDSFQADGELPASAPSVGPTGHP